MINVCKMKICSMHILDSFFSLTMAISNKATAVYRLIMVKKKKIKDECFIFTKNACIFIQVGSGGVGKSALTLQYMYDEVGVDLYNYVFSCVYKIL